MKIPSTLGETIRDHRISLQDIAVLAGVTKMIMSRHIRSPKKVAKETGKRTAKVMEEINYIPGRAPGMLLNVQSYILGILIPSFQNQFFADILAGIESIASEHNYQIPIANYSYDRDFEEKSVTSLLFHNIDGIIPPEEYHTIRVVKLLCSAAIPVVELTDVWGERSDMEAGSNNRQAAFGMACAMSEKRIRHKILYLGSKDGTRDGQRCQGYCDMMMLHNFSPLRMNPRVISSIHLGMQLMRNILSANPDLDGVLCTNDDITMGVFLLCRE